jgi:hypothetical protein
MALFTVHAMMLFAMTWFALPARRTNKILSAPELRKKLQALRSDGDNWRLERAANRDFNLRWDVVDRTWRQGFVHVALSSNYSLRVFLDARRREVRTQESIRSTQFFFGRIGMSWRFGFSLNYYSGPLIDRWSGTAYGFTRLWLPTVSETREFDVNTDEVKKEIRRLAGAAGWGVRPVNWWFETSRWGVLAGRFLVPPPLNRLSHRTLWATLYPVSFALTMAYLVAVTGARTGADISIVLLVTVGWFGVSGGAIFLLARTQKERYR